VCAWPQLVASYLDAPFVALGTDGFGRSDTRERLRAFFEVDRHQIVLAALSALRRNGALDAAVCAAAIERYRLPTEAPPPWRV
jgi:pyruvate dehydrogenase E1 component